MSKIDGKTRVYAILGDPVKQSLSPTMYNSLFESAGLNAVYTAFEVKAAGLADAVAGIRALGLQGVHLTCPHKEAVIPYLDRLSPKARVIGAVNVILNNRGTLFGDNTDGRGYLLSLELELDFDPRDKTVAILGAGGSARAIAHTLAQAGARKFYVLNRTISRAEKLAAALAEHATNSACEVLPLGTEAFTRISPELDLVIDATTPEPGNPVDTLPADKLPQHCICSDINYFRVDIPLLARAEARGMTTHRGLGMLVHQGALSLMLLTGLQVRPEDLESYIKSKLPAQRPPDIFT